MVENELKEKETESTGSKKQKKTRKPSSAGTSTLLQIVNGDFLSKEFVINNLSFIFYFIFLLILLVAKGYYDKQLTNEVDRAQKQMDELMGDYVAKKALLEEETKRITLVKDLAPIGLKETVNPTKVIRIKKQN